MGFNEILAYLPELTDEELAKLQLEVERLKSRPIDHGVSEEQWERVLATSEKLKTGQMKTKPSKTVLSDLMKKYP